MNQETEDVVDRMLSRNTVRVGDYVEVLKAHGGGIAPGEQGFVFETWVAGRVQLCQVFFPARDDIWSEDDGHGWGAPIEKLKRIYY